MQSVLCNSKTSLELRNYTQYPPPNSNPTNALVLIADLIFSQNSPIGGKKAISLVRGGVCIIGRRAGRQRGAFGKWASIMNMVMELPAMSGHP